MLLSWNLKTKVLADVHMAAMRGLQYVLLCVHGISNFNTIESNEISFPPVGAAFPCQTDYSSVQKTRHNTHVVSEGLLHSGPICNLKEKIKAARGLDNVTARVQPSPSVPLR